MAKSNERGSCPTLPPGDADRAAAEFSARLARLEATRRRTESGLMRALAEAWSEVGR